ncbi:MAG: hypothetical protein ABFE08_03970 [Armatimonadia bacterium]
MLALIALLFAVPAGAAELLLNGGFEALGTEGVPEGWSFANWGEVKYVSGKSVGGAAFGKKAVQLEGTIYPVAFGIFSYPVTLPDPHPSELLLTLSYRTKGSPLPEASLVTFTDDFSVQEWKTPQLAAEAMPLDPSPAWRSVTWRVHVLPAARQAVVLVRIHGAGILTLDAASLKTYPTEVQCEVLAPGVLTNVKGAREAQLKLTNHSEEEVTGRVELEAAALKGPTAKTGMAVTLGAGQSREVALRYSYPADKAAALTVRVVGKQQDVVYDQVGMALPGLLEGRLVRPAFRSTILPSIPIADVSATGIVNATPELRGKLRMVARLTGAGVSSNEFAADESGRWQVSLPTSGLLAESYMVQIMAYDGKAQVGELDLPLMKTDPKAAETGYDERMRLWVNGQLRMPVGIFYALEKPDFVDAAEAGFNTLVLPSRRAGADAIEAVSKLGLSAIISSANADQEFWKNVYSKYQVDPTVTGWYVLQRPEAQSPPAHPLAMADLYGRLRKLDPRRPVYLALSSVSRLEPYVPWCDVLMPWTEPEPAGDLRSVDALLQRAMQVAGGEKPVWPVIQIAGAAHTQDPRLDPKTTGRAPTAEEFRCMVYLSLARGAQGFFVYPFQMAASKTTLDYSVKRDAPELWEMIKRVGTEMKALAPILLEGESVAVETDNKAIAMRALRYKDATYVICANPYAQVVPVSFKVPSVAGTDLEVAFDQRRIVGPGGGQFGDLLDARAVRVYMGR